MAEYTKMLENVESASQLLKAMASPNRLMLLCLLADGELSVGELSDELSLRQATVSQHLARLRQEGLVAARRDAQTVYYAISDKTVEAVIRILYKTYCA